MHWRYRFVLFFFVFLFSLIISRLFYWQVVRAQELAALGQAQYGKQTTVPADRGEIKTSDGFPVAANKLSYLVYANPKQIRDKEKVASELAPVLGEDKATLSALLSMDRFWISLKPRIDNKVKERVAQYKFPGVGFEEHAVRYYPEGSMAAQLLGFVGKDNNGVPKGYFGLEGYYDRQLRGKDGVATIINDAQGNPILSKMNRGSGKVDGRSLTLHIDRNIQYLLDRDLKDGINRYGAVSGMAAIMDPKTGGIIAMSSFPTFDPRSYQDYTDREYKNPFITNTYEPGSTFKPLIMSSAIDAGLVTPETKCSICAGPVEVGGYEIKTWNDKYTADSTMTDVILHSDNTGMVFAGRLLGLDRMLSYLSKFGIGDMTNIDLQGEETPTMRPRDNWYPIDLATATFGQGITVTPIELLTAFSAIANNGRRMEPHIVKTIETGDGETIEIKPKVLSKPISSKTATIMTEMMVTAVDKGESKWAKPKGYRIAGKTGTAQIPVEGHYDPDKTIASFIGFAPADDPKFLMVVIIDRPSTSIYGSETAAPLFFKVAKNLLEYYNIPPTN